MPTYEYRCDACETKFEAWQGINDAPLTECSACGSGDVRRLISAGGGIVFKGPGFYATDYRSGPSGGGESGKSESSESGNGSKNSSATDGGKTDSTEKGGDD